MSNIRTAIEKLDDILLSLSWQYFILLAYVFKLMNSFNEKLDFKTVYNGYNIGSFRKNCREKYKKLTKKEQEVMKKEFDVISEDFLISKSRNKE